MQSQISRAHHVTLPRARHVLLHPDATSHYHPTSLHDRTTSSTWTTDFAKHTRRTSRQDSTIIFRSFSGSLNVDYQHDSQSLLDAYTVAVDVCPFTIVTITFSKLPLLLKFRRVVVEWLEQGHSSFALRSTTSNMMDGRL